MNGNNFESMIKKYADELIKMSRERTLPDTPEKEEETASSENDYPLQESEFFPFEDEEKSDRLSVSDIPGIEVTDFYEETAEEISPEKDKDELTDYATFSARVFTGNNAYPVENAKVLVVKNDELFTFLTTDRNGSTKKVRLPSLPESASLSPDSDKKSVNYVGEVYATGFTPRKGLLIEAVGGSDIILDIQMTPVSERLS